VDPRFLVDEAKLDRIAAVVSRHWPEAIDPAAIGAASLVRDVETARAALLDELDLSQLN
jgi:succinylarginine dihydrolase